MDLLKSQINPAIAVEVKLNATGTIRASKGDLYQLFLNILNNSIETLPNGGTITIETAKSYSRVIVQIEDNGLGIPSKHLSKLTDPFFTTKEVGQGIGLGLYIASKILNKLNGSIKFDSEDHEGTTVIISIPIFQVKDSK